jgi:hypothetical protein
MIFIFDDVVLEFVVVTFIGFVVVVDVVVDFIM